MTDDARAQAPSLSLLCKLGSIVVHVDEYTSPGGHPIDFQVIRAILDDPEVQTWIKKMGPLLPVKR
jgi:hypothetical protein